jgi:rSAM/selenodomain-associated transferase 1
VKTRLIPALGAAGAAKLQANLILRALRAARDAALGPVELWCAPDASHPFFLGCGRSFAVGLHPQEDGDLGERMDRALRLTLATSERTLLIGSDIPSMTPAYLREADRALRDADVVLGPAEDGGYVLIGLKRAAPALFQGVPWGEASVLAETRKRIASAGLRLRELPALPDVDRPGDLDRLAEAFGPLDGGHLQLPPRSAIGRRIGPKTAKEEIVIRKVAYFSMQVPNRPGVGVNMLKAIAKDKLSLLAFTGFPNGGKAQVDFVPAKPGEFARTARKMGVKLGKRKTAFLVQGQDRVGALTRILDTLAQARINMTAMDAVTAGSKRFGAIFWVKPKDVGRVSRLLRAK